jgi:hypothetical protein
MPLFFLALSVFGIMVGVFLIREGLFGNGLGATVTLIVGIFVMIKEILDIIFAR